MSLHDPQSGHSGDPSDSRHPSARESCALSSSRNSSPSSSDLSNMVADRCQSSSSLPLAWRLLGARDAILWSVLITMMRQHVAENVGCLGMPQAMHYGHAILARSNHGGSIELHGLIQVTVLRSGTRAYIIVAYEYHTLQRTVAMGHGRAFYLPVHSIHLDE